MRIAAYLGVIAVWAYGLFRFVHLPPTLTRRGGLKRSTWIAVLTAVGVFAAMVLGIRQIESKGLTLLALVPVLAWIDNRMVYREPRIGFWFFFFICFFEISTVFLVAAAVRAAIDTVFHPDAN